MEDLLYLMQCQKYSNPPKSFRKDDLMDRYFEWLMNEVKGTYYDELLLKLYSLPFDVPEDDMDHSRMMDGLKLRDIFVRETRNNYEVPSKTCSFLEMLIAMAKRLDDQVLYEVKFGDRSVDWFWMFIDNMDMSDATNEHWNLHWDKYVYNRYCKIMKRLYAPNGKGGIFIVLREGVDCREVDLWRQLMWWTSENIRAGVIE